MTSFHGNSHEQHNQIRSVWSLGQSDKTPRYPPGVPRAVGQVKCCLLEFLRSPPADNRADPDRENFNWDWLLISGLDVVPLHTMV